MAGKTSAGMIEAMKMVRAGVTAYKAAKRANIHHTTIYRSQLYKDWRDGKDRHNPLKR